MESVIFTMGDQSVYVDDFKYVYEKHNSNSEDFYSHKSVHEYLDLYTNFRLKIRDLLNMTIKPSQRKILTTLS